MLVRHMRQVCILIAAVAAAVLAPDAAGQTTRPASAGWSQAVRSLAGALTAADSAQIRGMLTADASVKPFFGSSGGLTTLVEQAELSGIVSSRAYRVPASTLATDLAEDFRDCAFVREDQKGTMIPADPISYQRAETTAGQWIKAVLGAEQGEQVGLIVLWIPEKSGELTTIRHGRPLFVLAIGDATGETVRIRKLVFGDPLEGLRRANPAKKEPSFSSAQH